MACAYGPAGEVLGSWSRVRPRLDALSSIGVRAPCRNVDCTCSSFSVSTWGKVAGSIFAIAAAAAAVKPPVSAAIAARERAIAARCADGGVKEGQYAQTHPLFYPFYLKVRKAVDI